MGSTPSCQTWLAVWPWWILAISSSSRRTGYPTTLTRLWASSASPNVKSLKLRRRPQHQQPLTARRLGRQHPRPPGASSIVRTTRPRANLEGRHRLHCLKWKRTNGTNWLCWGWRICWTTGLAQALHFQVRQDFLGGVFPGIARGEKPQVPTGSFLVLINFIQKLSESLEYFWIFRKFDESL